MGLSRGFLRPLLGHFGPIQRVSGAYPGAFWVYSVSSEAYYEALWAYPGGLEAYLGSFGSIQGVGRPMLMPFGHIQGQAWPFVCIQVFGDLFWDTLGQSRVCGGLL